MRINIDKNMVEFQPENSREKAETEALWRVLIDCNGPALKMSPVGEYAPQKNHTTASFYIEGLQAEQPTYTAIRVEEDCTVSCMTCNNLIQLKKGDPIPICCGKLMEIVD
jgi:hypothetical protein